MLAFDLDRTGSRFDKSCWSLQRSEVREGWEHQALTNQADRINLIYVSLSISFKMALVVFHNMTQSLFIQKAPVYQVDR